MLLSLSKRKYPPFPLFSYFFPWLCARDICYIIFCHLLHISSGKTGNLFSLLLCSLWWVQIFGYVLACRLYSFVCTAHHLIIIIVPTYLKHWTLLVRYVLSSVSKIKHILSVIHYTICGSVCFEFTHFSYDDWKNIYTLSIIIIKSEVWNITHRLGLGHETIMSAVCLSIFFRTQLPYP